MEKEKFDQAIKLQEQITALEVHLEKMKEIKNLIELGHDATLTIRACNRFPDLKMVTPEETLDMEIYKCEKKIKELTKAFVKI